MQNPITPILPVQSCVGQPGADGLDVVEGPSPPRAQIADDRPARNGSSCPKKQVGRDRQISLAGQPVRLALADRRSFPPRRGSRPRPATARRRSEWRDTRAAHLATWRSSPQPSRPVSDPGGGSRSESAIFCAQASIALQSRRSRSSGGMFLAIRLRRKPASSEMRPAEHHVLVRHDLRRQLLDPLGLRPPITLLRRLVLVLADRAAREQPHLPLPELSPPAKQPHRVPAPARHVHGAAQHHHPVAVKRANLPRPPDVDLQARYPQRRRDRVGDLGRRAALASRTRPAPDRSRSTDLRFEEPLEAAPDPALLSAADRAHDRTHQPEQAAWPHVPRPAHPGPPGNRLERQRALGLHHRRGGQGPNAPRPLIRRELHVIGTVRPIVLSSARNRVPTPIGPSEISSARTIRGL